MPNPLTSISVLLEPAPYVFLCTLSPPPLLYPKLPYPWLPNKSVAPEYLFLGAQAGLTNLVNVLVSDGASVDKVYTMPYTMWLCALVVHIVPPASSHPECCCLQESSHGLTALIGASMSGHSKTASALCRAKAMQWALGN